MSDTNTTVFIFLLMSGIAPVVGAIIIGQDALMAEMQSGTVVNAQPDSLPLSVALALEQPLPALTPVIGTLLGSAFFVAVAIWRFNREEF